MELDADFAAVAALLEDVPEAADAGGDGVANIDDIDMDAAVAILGDAPPDIPVGFPPSGARLGQAYARCSGIAAGAAGKPEVAEHLGQLEQQVLR